MNNAGSFSKLESWTLNIESWVFSYSNQRYKTQDTRFKTQGLYSSITDANIEGFLNTLSNSNIQVIGPENLSNTLHSRLYFDKDEKNYLLKLFDHNLGWPHLRFGLCSSEGNLIRAQLSVYR